MFGRSLNFFLNFISFAKKWDDNKTNAKRYIEKGGVVGNRVRWG